MAVGAHTAVPAALAAKENNTRETFKFTFLYC